MGQTESPQKPDVRSTQTHHCQLQKSAVAGHMLDAGRATHFDGTHRQSITASYVNRLLKETIDIRLHVNGFNRQEAFTLNRAWQSITQLLTQRKEAHPPPQKKKQGQTQELVTPLGWHTFTGHGRVLLHIRRAWVSSRSEVLMGETNSVSEILTVSKPERLTVRDYITVQCTVWLTAECSVLNLAVLVLTAKL